ncbi:MAG: hypothetical protein JWM33_3389 [Caulobacteraceae bacterium]|jgi:hypothetical protein|nr:hypothetical protein [Caulobacteraceae bacterium]
MELIKDATQLLNELPHLLGRLWLAETVASLVMAVLVSLPLSRLWGIARGAGAAVALLASLWLAVGLAQAALAVRSHRVEWAAEPLPAAPEVAALPVRPVARPHRHAPPEHPPNCFRVLTDPSQSTC